MVFLINFTQTFPVKKTKANLREVTSYLAPKPGLNPFLKLNPVATGRPDLCPAALNRHLGAGGGRG